MDERRVMGAVNSLREDFRHFAYGNGDGRGGADGRIRALENWKRTHDRQEEEQKQERRRQDGELRSFLKDVVKLLLPIVAAAVLAHWGFGVSF